MKPWIRWGTTLGLVGSTLLGSLIITGTQVLALTEEQILQKLLSVPVFTITDNEGSPLVASSKEGENGEIAVAGVFIERADAQAFITRLRSSNPTLAGSVKVVPVRMSEVYELALEAKENQENLEFAYVPAEDQVNTAISLINQIRKQENKAEIKAFNGVPLFAARGGKQGGYLTVQQDNEQIIPFFFNKAELQSMIDRFKREKPDLANTVTIQVLDLEGVLETFRKDNNPKLDRVWLIQPQESVDFINSQ